MSATSRGIALERAAARYYKERGYVVASRRHFGGGGDLVATKPGPILYTMSLDPLSQPYAEVLLIEVKGTSRPPWQATWGPAKRQELIDDARQAGATPVLWWKPPRGELSITGPEDWPNGR